jgi:hypothetical protein
MFFILTFLQSKAQTITVSGKVVDKETKEALVFASISIKGKTLGTITNLQGDFDFHLPSELRNDFLVVNMMGYNKYEVPIWSILDVNPLVIEIEKSITILDEVVVIDSLSGSDIVQIAISRINENYPMQPYLMNGFYRDLKKVAGTYISMLEAAIKVYDEDYKEPRNKSKLRERVSLQEVRRSIGYGNKFTAFFDQDNLLEVLLLNNSVRYRLFPEEKTFYNGMVRLHDSYYDGQEIFVVTHKEKTPFELTMYIEKSSYGIIHLEYAEKGVSNLSKKRGLESKLVSSRRVNDFKKIEGKFFLNYLSLDTQVNWYNVSTGKLEFETELNQSLLINEIFPNTSIRIESKDKMKNYGLQFQDPPYNKVFWDSYNVIKESPLDRKIIEDLERQGPLEKQFKNNQ